MKSFEVIQNTCAERIRLSGIDCPEKGQAYGKKAKQAVSALVIWKEEVLETHIVDKYGSTLADVLLPDGTNLNQELVTGLVLWYRKCTNPLQGGWKNSVQMAQGILLAVQSTVWRQTPYSYRLSVSQGNAMLVPVDRHLIATPKEGQHEVRAV